MPDFQAQIVVGFRHRLFLPEAFVGSDVFSKRLSNREWTPMNANRVGTYKTNSPIPLLP